MYGSRVGHASAIGVSAAQNYQQQQTPNQIGSPTTINFYQNQHQPHQQQLYQQQSRSYHHQANHRGHSHSHHDSLHLQASSQNLIHKPQAQRLQHRNQAALSQSLLTNQYLGESGLLTLQRRQLSASSVSQSDCGGGGGSSTCDSAVLLSAATEPAVLAGPSVLERLDIVRDGGAIGAPPAAAYLEGSPQQSTSPVGLIRLDTTTTTATYTQHHHHQHQHQQQQQDLNKQRLCAVVGGPDFGSAQQPMLATPAVWPAQQQHFGRARASSLSTPMAVSPASFQLQDQPNRLHLSAAASQPLCYQQAESPGSSLGLASPLSGSLDPLHQQQQQQPPQASVSSSSYASSQQSSSPGCYLGGSQQSASSMSPSDALNLGINLEQYISKRNERERSRVRNVNDAFDNLKNSLPLEGERSTKRISKVEILRTAINYIKNLEYTLGQSQGQGRRS